MLEVLSTKQNNIHMAVFKIIAFDLLVIRHCRVHCMHMKHSVNLERHIRKTCPWNIYPLKPHFYVVKLRYTGVCIFFLISNPKHSFRVPAIYVLREN